MASKSRLEVSVVIPCYNAEAYLKETIESVLSQTYPPLEILVIDDGSTDSSAEIAKSFGESVQLVQQPNSGESVARNQGIELAKGDWIALLDADDKWHPAKLEKQIRLAEDPELVCIHTDWETFGTEEITYRLSELKPDQRYDIVRVATEGGLTTPSLLFKKSTNVRFPVWTQTGEDLLFVLDLLQTGRFSMVPEVLTYVRKHGKNQSARFDIEIDWFKSVEAWLDSSSADVSLTQKKQILLKWQARLANMAACMLYRGRMEDFRKFQTSVSWIRPFWPQVVRKAFYQLRLKLFPQR